MVILDLFYRPQLSPGRTPSPMEYNPYTSPVMQPQLSPQYQPSSSNVTQQPSIGIHVPQQYSFLQNNLQDAEQLIALNKITSEQQNTGLQPIYNDGKITYYKLLFIFFFYMKTKSLHLYILFYR